MRLASLFALAAVGLSSFVAFTDDKEKALSGAFVRKVEGMQLKFVFKKDNTLDYIITQGEVGCTIEAKYTREKDGVLKCEITKFEKKGDFPVSKEKGYTFSFKVEVKDKKISVSDFKGDDIDDGAKQALEGDYETASD
jgi:hypothetical protein